MPKQRKATPNQIEKIYDSGQNRVTQERNDFLLPQIRDFVREKKWLNYSIFDMCIQEPLAYARGTVPRP
jgi:hypothetical protein